MNTMQHNHISTNQVGETQDQICRHNENVVSNQNHGGSHNHTDNNNHVSTHDHGCCHGHGCHHHHHDGSQSRLLKFLPETATTLLFVVALICFHFLFVPAKTDWIIPTAYLLALLPVGLPILRSTLSEWRHGSIFNEFTLMLLSAVGAFCINEYPEGVAVLLFYSIGEKLEDVVSGDVRGQIKRLLGKMPRYASVVSGDDNVERRNPADVVPGDIISVLPGEAVPLDGILISCDETGFDTSAMTGESVPRSFRRGEEISAGLIPVEREIRLRVTKPYKDSAMMRIMRMIEDSSANRSHSESVLRRITKWYTPAVLVAAILLFTMPWLASLFTPSFTFHWEEWLRRSLVFLVCSCPCALVVSIPLTYFASIGIASKHGILFKGHRQLDDMRKFTLLLLDKTGTVTTGKFHVTNIHSFGSSTQEEILAIAAGVDTESSHPLATAICNEAEARNIKPTKMTDVRSVSHGMEALHNGRKVLVGSPTMLKKSGIEIPAGKTDNAFTMIYVAQDNICLGYISLSDTIKVGAEEAVEKVHKLGIKKVGVLSGDRTAPVARVAKEIEADFYHAELLPEQKVSELEHYKSQGDICAFAGDGINDAPVLAASSVGIAMGSLGADIAIESADVVIAGDDLRKIPEGIKISRKVWSLLLENISFAFGVKLLVMTLGAFGIATLWAAVFADTGVTLIAVIWTLCRLKIWKLRK